MIPKYAIGALVGIGLISGAWFHGNYHGKKVKDLEIQTARAEASEAARTEERAKQEAINHVLKQQNDDLAAINANLVDDISELRNRPDRRPVPETTETRCQGASGADLSRQDASFLTREAARADRLRTALIACYAYADTIAKEIERD